MVEARSVKHKRTPNIYTGGIWNLGEHSSAPALLSKHRVIEIFKYFIIKCVPVHNILLYNSRVTFDPVLFLPWIPIFSPTPGCEFLGVNCKHLYFFVLFIIHKVNIRNICVKLIQINQTMIDWNHDAKKMQVSLKVLFPSSKQNKSQYYTCTGVSYNFINISRLIVVHCTKMFLF